MRRAIKGFGIMPHRFTVRGYADATGWAYDTALGHVGILYRNGVLDRHEVKHRQRYGPKFVYEKRVV